MNARLLLLRAHLPGIVRRSILRELLTAMATAFQRDGPPTAGLSAEALNDLVVQRSSAWADEAIATQQDLAPLEQRLFSEAEVLGRRARDRLRIRSETDGLVAAGVIYRAIGIDLRSRSHGGIEVSSCAFARVYHPAVCRLLSSMDSGLIAGLTGADGLLFTSRLTEGAPTCRAYLLHSGGVP